MIGVVWRRNGRVARSDGPSARAPGRSASSVGPSSEAIASVLAALNVEQYGYSLRKRLADEGLEVDEGTLYPLLRRLESQGLLASEWREEGRRTKRFYRLSPAGAAMLGQLLEEWRVIDVSLRGLLREYDR